MHYFEESHQTQIECRHCHKPILAPNHPIHQIRCLQIMKKHQQKNKPQIVEVKPEKRQSFRFQEKKEEKEKRKIEQIPLYKKQEKRQNQADIDDKIPCFCCGYLQTLEELDTHPGVCNERAQKCPNCENEFPRSLMEEHQKCCSRRRISSNLSDRQTRCRGCNVSLPPSMLLLHLQNCPNCPRNNQIQECPRCHARFISREREIHMQTCNGGRVENDWSDDIQPSFDSLSDHEQEDSQISDDQSQDPYQQALRDLRQRRPIAQINSHRFHGGQNRPNYSISRGLREPQMLEFSSNRLHQLRDIQQNRNRLQILNRQSQAIRNLSEQIVQMMRQMSSRRQQLDEEEEDGLSKQQIAQLERVKYHPKIKGEKDLCTICYCDLEEGEIVLNLRCNHQYHPECIIQWLKKMAKCPVCKRVQTDRQRGSDYDDSD